MTLCAHQVHSKFAAHALRVTHLQRIESQKAPQPRSCPVAMTVPHTDCGPRCSCSSRSVTMDRRKAISTSRSGSSTRPQGKEGRCVRRSRSVTVRRTRDNCGSKDVLSLGQVLRILPTDKSPVHVTCFAATQDLRSAFSPPPPLPVLRFLLPLMRHVAPSLPSFLQLYRRRTAEWGCQTIPRKYSPGTEGGAAGALPAWPLLGDRDRLL